MADVKLEFLGDSTSGQAAIDKLVKKQAQLTESLRTMKREAVENSKQSIGGFDAMHKSVASVAASVLSVTAAVGLARSGYTAWRTQTDGLVESHKKLVAEITKVGVLTGTGNADLMKFLKSLKGATATQGVEAYLGVSSSAPGMSQLRKEQTAAEVARLGVTGVNISEFAPAAGDFSELLKGRSAGDAVDVALKAQELAGDRRGELSSPTFQRTVKSLTATGMSEMEALATGVTSLSSDQRSQSLQAIAAAATAPAGTYGGRGKSHLERQFEGMTATQRREALFGGGAMAREILGDKALATGQIDKAEIASALGQLQQADASDYRLLKRQSLASEPIGREALQGQLVAEGAEANVIGATPATELARSRQYIRDKAYARGGWAYGRALVGEGFSRLNEFTGAGSAHQAEAELRASEAMGVIGKGDSKALIDALNKNTEATLKNTPKEKLSATEQGQIDFIKSVNVDAHSE